MRLIGGMRFNAADGGALVYNDSISDALGAAQDSARSSGRGYHSPSPNDSGGGSNNSTSRNRPRSQSPNRSGGNRPSLPRTPSQARQQRAAQVRADTPRARARTNNKNKRGKRGMLEEEDLPTLPTRAEQLGRTPPEVAAARIAETEKAQKYATAWDAATLATTPIAIPGTPISLSAAVSGAREVVGAFSPTLAGKPRNAPPIGLIDATKLAPGPISKIGGIAKNQQALEQQRLADYSLGNIPLPPPDVINRPAPPSVYDSRGNSPAGLPAPARVVRSAGNAAQGAQTPNPAAINPNRWRLWRRRHHGILL